MKYIYIAIAILIVVIGGKSFNQGASVGKKQSIHRLSPTPLPPPSTVTQSLFIPYWTVTASKDNNLYDSYYYFGISPTREGRIDEDEGLKQIALVENIPNKNKELVLRMLDASVIEVVLKDKIIQKTLISEVKNILIGKSFSGLILDLEVSFTLQSNKQKQITDFVQQMCTEIHSDYKSCSMLVYGDFIYRKRPYDLKKLSQYTDRILLMAYDFHKAGGEPGPNFPFDDKKKYGYDFKQMILDAIALVPKEKIEVVFGMYGYDWTLNEQGTPLKQAKALTLKEINILLANRESRNANRQDNENETRYTLHVSPNGSGEKSIPYIDSDGRSHVIWYEDEESAQIKTDYLQKQGILRVSYWAYGYY